MHRPVRSGAAWRRSPHQKSAGREREEGKEKEERKRKEEKEKTGEKERKGEESKRERCITPVGVKHPLRTVKRFLKTPKEGELKKAKKARREEEETEKAGEKMVTSTEDRLRCENTGSVFYSSIKPYLS